MQKDKIQFFKSIFRGFLLGGGFFLGFFSTALLAVAVNGTIKTWTSGETLYASDLNTTINSLKTAIEGIPNWTKNGSNAYYTDGNVGIGTSDPKSDGTTNRKQLSFGGFGAIWLNNDSSNPFGIDTVSNKLRIFAGAVFNSFQIQLGNMAVSDVFTPYMTIGDGVSNRNYVGIGTSSPKAVLDVRGTANSNGQLYVYNSTASNGSGIVMDSASGGATLSILSGGVTKGAYQYHVTNDTLSMQNNSSNGVFLKLSSGQVGINTISPSQALHIVGDACTTGTSSGITACASDRRLKNNIQPIQNALDTILKFKPVSFTWNEKAKENFGYENGQKDIGVIAQDFEKINPEWVETTKSGFKRVKDGFTKWYPIKAIQELKSLFDSKNVELANNISLLQSENEILKKELTQLKQQNKNFQLSLEKINKKLEGMNYAKR
ncbi:MAG: tail fiber domain-containing protein [Leptospiraceae bacterium]|nr:tail fiber domain-containing protein [Leptospiraceae bacterium]